MKKSILAISLLGTIGFTLAEYTVKIPLEQAQGGSLPNGSIHIGNQNPAAPTENWMPAEPTYTTWAKEGEVYDCSNWAPSPSTITIGQDFYQNASDCKQDLTRTRQNREQEAITLAYRDVGAPITESQIITTTYTRKSVGTNAVGCYSPTGFGNTGWYETYYWGGGKSLDLFVNGVAVYQAGGEFDEDSWMLYPDDTPFNYEQYRIQRGEGFGGTDGVNFSRYTHNFCISNIQSASIYNKKPAIKRAFYYPKFDKVLNYENLNRTEKENHLGKGGNQHNNRNKLNNIN